MGKRCAVAVAPCGCIHVADVIDPEDDKCRLRERAKWMAEVMADGLIVKTMDVEAVRGASFGCPVCRPPKQAELALAGGVRG